LAFVTSPYRDENESLRAEVQRLRAELAARRITHGKVAALLVAIDFLALVALRPWLNGRSDVHFWLGVAIVVGIGVAAAASALGWRNVR
jgi:hypothetical protein